MLPEALTVIVAELVPMLLMEIQGVPVNEIISRGYRSGEQTGRVLPTGGSASPYLTALP